VPIQCRKVRFFQGCGLVRLGVEPGLTARQAENAAEYLGKGSHVNIVGRLRNNNYEMDGAEVYSLAFIRLNFLQPVSNMTLPGRLSLADSWFSITGHSTDGVAPGNFSWAVLGVLDALAPIPEPQT
jgi:hypothetical protein